MAPAKKGTRPTPKRGAAALQSTQKFSPLSPADAVDEQLAKYRSMRDFAITAEPAGTLRGLAANELPFCIQKHAASHLHYDFRLGWNGVLKSWAVAKGPSYYPGDKRLAVQVEDHPIEYGGFEGIIPAGQYGGGTVMLWDQGTWEPQPGHDVDAGLREGSLKFLMHGEKMRGKWTLIRMGGRAATERKPNWLLIKEHDEHERAHDAPCVTDAEPQSIVTGRSLEEIEHNQDHVWNSKETAGSGQAWYRAAAKPVSTQRTELVQRQSPARTVGSGSKRISGPAAPIPASFELSPASQRQFQRLSTEAQPSFVKPQLALEGSSPPAGDAWLHELKLDGYRIQARKTGDKVQLLTRSGLDWTYRVPAVAAAVARLAARAITLDGEVVVLLPDGTTSFAKLQASFQEGANNPLTYFCFDLLHLDGRNPRDLPLLARKQILSEVLAAGSDDPVRLSEHIASGGEAMFKKACELHAEGIVSKLAEAPYKSGRGGDWLKSKCLHEQEFVIGGYTLSSDGEDRIGSLLLGYYRDGKLIYAGRTGTGFTQKLKRSLLRQMQEIRAAQSAYLHVPQEARRGALWVKPMMVAQVRFATWTAEDLVRQAAFLGLREDKSAMDVVREEAAVAPQPKVVKRTPPRSNHATTAKVVARKPTKAHADVTPAISPGTSTIKPQSPETTRTSASRHNKDLALAHPPVRLTHPAKVLDVESGVTKQMLADYLWAVSERMLPHIAGRPLSLVRCPEGSTKPCFYQKHVNHMLPPGVGSIPVPDKKTGVFEPYITLETKEALAGLAQMGVLEVHPWSSRNDDLEHADRIIFDLDPDESLSWQDVTAAATEVRQRLKSRGLQSFLKTTGGKGLHVIVPITPELEWTAVKQWTHTFVLAMERAAPTRYLTKMTKAARTGRIYLDYLRNERGATAVAPYSSRARAGLGVSLPLAWSELRTERPVFRVDNFSSWQSRLKRDPWAKMAELRQHLT